MDLKKQNNKETKGKILKKSYKKTKGKWAGPTFTEHMTAVAVGNLGDFSTPVMFQQKVIMALWKHKVERN